jgi:hypothetical protein
LKDKRIRTLWIVLILFLFLLLGRASPLYFIFSFPGFNAFRVPSRFLLLITFVGSILAATMFDIIQKTFLNTDTWRRSLRKILPVLRFTLLVASFLILILDLFRFSYSYPPMSNAKLWLSPPTVTTILQNKTERITSIGAGNQWNQTFLKYGWTDIHPYAFFLNTLDANANTLFSYPHIEVNSTLKTRRSMYFSAALDQIDSDKSTSIATLSALSQNMFNLASVKHILTPYILENVEWKRIGEVKSPEHSTLRDISIYENVRALPEIYFANHIEIKETIEDVYKSIAQLKNSERPAYIEQAIQPEIVRFDSNARITIRHDTVNSYDANTQYPSILVQTTSYYPGWEAYVDHVKTPIFPVNINQRGIVVPPGNHVVSFQYNPRSFSLGKQVTISSLLIILLIVCFGFV